MSNDRPVSPTVTLRAISGRVATFPAIASATAADPSIVLVTLGIADDGDLEEFRQSTLIDDPPLTLPSRATCGDFPALIALRAEWEQLYGPLENQTTFAPLGRRPVRDSRPPTRGAASTVVATTCAALTRRQRCSIAAVPLSAFGRACRRR